MKGFRTFLGVTLILFASAAMGAATALYWLGRAVMPDQGARGRQHGSGDRGTVLYPHTVRLESGGYVTLYSIGGK